MTDWDRNAELARLEERGFSKQDMCIARMYVIEKDLEIQAQRYAWWKAEHDRRKARHTMDRRYTHNEKSGEMAATWADAQDDVHEANLAYRTAEQLVSADKALLQILHAELEKWRTEQANQRIADDQHRRIGT